MSDVTASPASAGNKPVRRTMLAQTVDILVLDQSALIGCLIILGFCLVALCASWIAPFDPTEQHILDALRTPNATYWLGTDEYGRDLFSRMIYGTRPALLVGTLSILVSLLIGVPIGLAAGYRLGWFDRVIGWLTDIMLSFPSLLLALLMVTLLGSGTTTLIFVIGISNVPVFVRLTRSAAMVVRNNDYVTASRSFGALDARIMRQHVFPNVLGPIIVMSSLTIAGAIRDEASLSFLGMGIQPPNPSWGNLIRDGVSVILQAPWMAVAPGLALTLSVLAFNMLGDSLRDMFDPRDIAASIQKK
ncbi:ABC transporter permease [Rhizobium sp. CCGE532]|uniref:ABC transporter permease n=1 Tax=Rhizobium sp. CCGE532 TaxID=2364272 RepID=UPI000EA8DF88|nr:ABC transporter permease [Rhizobium sp. CCGE532]AYG76824.1 ABC transporter permease [Rhizobium sp. CCGE532]